MPFSLDISHRNRYPLSNELTPKSILDCGVRAVDGCKETVPGRTPSDNANHDRANGFGVGSAILVSVF